MARTQITFKGKINSFTTTSANLNFENSFNYVFSSEVNVCLFSIRQVCQWCSNCPTGKCIPKNDDCEQANYCRRQQRAITSANDCVERLCQASDCEKCWKKSSCIWTRQFKRSSKYFS